MLARSVAVHSQPQENAGKRGYLNRIRECLFDDGGYRSCSEVNCKTGMINEVSWAWMGVAKAKITSKSAA